MPDSSLAAGTPKSRTEPMPAVAISVASATSSEIEKRSMPGIESTSSRTFSPATTKRGWIRWRGRELGLSDQAAQSLGAPEAAHACGGERH